MTPNKQMNPTNGAANTVNKDNINPAPFAGYLRDVRRRARFS